MKKLVVMLALGMTIGVNAFAQTAVPKFGYVNSQELLSVMPQMAKADSALKIFGKQYQDQLEAMAKDYEAKVQAYQKDEKTMSDAVKEVKQKEIQDLQGRTQEFQQSAQEKVGKRKEELYKPILDKADAAIKEVAKEKNLDYVFDASGGALLYTKEADNIIGAVKAKLGIK